MISMQSFRDAKRRGTQSLLQTMGVVEVSADEEVGSGDSARGVCGGVTSFNWGRFASC